MRFLLLIFFTFYLLYSDILNNADDNFPRDKNFTMQMGLKFYGDNLEDELNYFDSFTDLATRVYGTINYEVDSLNSFQIGGFLSQDFYRNTKINGLSNYDLIAFYSFQKEVEENKFNAFFGIMPREKQKILFSRNIMSDRFSFYNPNIKGMLFSYENNHGLSEALLDWYGGNGGSGIASFDRVRFGMNHKYHFFSNLLNIGLEYLFHHQKDRELLKVDSKAQNPTILDQMNYKIYIGSDLGDFIGLKKAYFGLAYLANAERFRFANYYEEFENLGGIETSINLQYKFMGFESSIYSGDPQMKSFSLYKSSVYNALPYYHASFNNINEIYLKFNPSKNVDFKFSYFLVFYKNNEVDKLTHFLHQGILSISIKSKEIKF